MSEKYILGIDVGATNIKAALVDFQGRPKHFQILLTEKERGPGHILKKLQELIVFYKEKLEKAELLQGIGLALPGSVNDTTGICAFGPNLRWKNVKVSQELKNRTGLPIKLINDANAACLGEYFFGSGRNCSNLICITIGTGIGSGFILDNKLLIGPSGAAGEAGHMVIVEDGPQCSCGRRGCLEALVSATAIVKRTREKINAGHPTLITEMIDGKHELLTTEIIAEAAAKKDELAINILQQTKEYLVTGLTNLVNLFNPEKIILGGGVIHAGDVLLKNLESEIKKSAFPTLREPLEVVPSLLGNKAGVIGAASLFFKKIKTIGG